jgi:amino-acid N-acetyltransferase
MDELMSLTDQVPDQSDDASFDQRAIAWFRDASPYIRAHRDATLVIAVPGSVLTTQAIDTLVHDLALLHHLGLRLVVCFGLRSQVDSLLATKSLRVDGRRVTDDQALEAIVSAAGVARTDLEARLSAGLPNTPMAGAHLSVSSGNFVSARPFGVHKGVDFQHTGSIREVQGDAIRTLLNAEHLVLQSPIGHSLTGEIFNLTVDEVAEKTAIALGADKLVYLLDHLPTDQHGHLLREMDAHRLEQVMHDESSDSRLHRVLTLAASASTEGVDRVHLLSEHEPDALLRELFTRDGSGTLVTADRWESVRPARIEDVGGIIALISPLQDDGTLATRSREQLELDIADFVVSERDGTVIACAALFTLNDTQSAEIGCIATHPDYRRAGRADALLSHLEMRAQRNGCERVFLLSTRTGHWFIERGYVEASADALPPQRRDSYNRQRNSKVYLKTLGQSRS